MIMKNSSCYYEIEPRPDKLGGGWRLRLIEDGVELGGGVFPLAEYADEKEPEKAAYSDGVGPTVGSPAAIWTI